MCDALTTRLVRPFCMLSANALLIGPVAPSRYPTGSALRLKPVSLPPNQEPGSPPRNALHPTELAVSTTGLLLRSLMVKVVAVRTDATLKIPFSGDLPLLGSRKFPEQAPNMPQMSPTERPWGVAVVTTG